MVHVVTTIAPNWSKRFLLIGCFHVFGIAVFSIYAQSANPSPSNLLTTEEQSWIAAPPEIYVAIDPTYQPVEWADEQGRHQDVTADYLARFEQHLDLRLRVAPSLSSQDKPNSDPGLKVDARTASAVTPKRLKTWWHSTPYLKFPAFLITHNNAQDRLTPNHLPNAGNAVVSVLPVRRYWIKQEGMASLKDEESVVFLANG